MGGVFDALYGASLSALYLAGRQMGYTLVYVGTNSLNCYFLRDDLPGVKAFEQAHSLAALHPAKIIKMQRPGASQPTQANGAFSLPFGKAPTTLNCLGNRILHE